MGVAHTVLLEGRARFAAPDRLYDDLTGASLHAATALGSASRPGVEVGKLARDRASVGVARASFVQVRALDAFESRFCCGGASAFLDTAAAILATRRPRGEPGDLAVDRAVVTVARELGDEAGARNTTEVGVNQHAPHLVHAAGAASLAALACEAPVGDLAINWARVLVANGCLHKGRAFLAAVLRLHKDRPMLMLSAGAASDRASRPLVPCRDNTLDNARVVLAFHGVLKRRAALAAVGGRLREVAVAGPGAHAARGGARAPGLPRRDTAVDGAGLGTAKFGLVEAAAFFATVDSFAGGAAGTSGVAAAAFLGARRPIAPITRDTIDWAVVRVAELGAAGRQAVLALLDLLHEDNASTGLMAGSARGRASAPVVPGAHHAVNRALATVAIVDVIQRKAMVSAVHCVANDGAVARHAARATGLVARRPVAPN